MQITMILTKETKNFLVYAQTNDGQNALPEEVADVLKWYLSKEVFSVLPELIKVTIEVA